MKNNWNERKKLIAGIITLVLALFGGGGYYTVHQDTTIIDHNPSRVVESLYEQPDEEREEEQQYFFRSASLLESHYEKHGIEMGFASAKEYERAAAKVITHPDALHKVEAEDGDDIYYREVTNEFVVVSVDGYIRTYYNPVDGIDYFQRQ